jgi:hypothetical protein
LEREELWLAMAEQFLDTETRHELPALAAHCLRLGLTPEAARAIWRHEVAPVVGGNLWSVAGEWSGWPRDWLIPRVEARAHNPSRWPLAYYLVAWPVDGSWRAVERCMALLAPLAPDERARRVADLTWLARVCFDLVPSKPPPGRTQATLRRLYETEFAPTFEPLIVRDKISGESRAICRARVERALAEVG